MSLARTQSTVATSSGHAEVNGVISVAKECLGIGALLRELGVATAIVVKCDSSAAIAIHSRLGFGRTMKHIEVSLLALQQMVRRKRLRIEKIGTEENTSDIFTKYLDQVRFFTSLPRLGYRPGERIVRCF